MLILLSMTYETRQVKSELLVLPVYTEVAQ